MIVVISLFKHKMTVKTKEATANINLKFANKMLYKYKTMHNLVDYNCETSHIGIYEK